MQHNIGKRVHNEFRIELGRTASNDDRALGSGDFLRQGLQDGLLLALEVAVEGAIRQRVGKLQITSRNLVGHCCITDRTDARPNERRTTKQTRNEASAIRLTRSHYRVVVTRRVAL